MSTPGRLFFFWGGGGGGGGGNVKRREILQDIVTTGMIEGMREKILDGLTE